MSEKNTLLPYGSIEKPLDPPSQQLAVQHKSKVRALSWIIASGLVTYAL